MRPIKAKYLVAWLLVMAAFCWLNAPSPAMALEQVTLSGQVVDAAANGVADVRILFKSWTRRGARTEVVITGADGSFSKTVRKGWTGFIVPRKPDCTFTPTHFSLYRIQEDKNDLNFLAACITKPDVTLSGVIKDADNNGMGGVTVYFKGRRGSASASVVTAADGSYSQTFAGGWNGLVLPRKENCTFSPRYRWLYNILENKTDLDFTAACRTLFTLKGKVTQDGNPLAEVPISIVVSRWVGRAIKKWPVNVVKTAADGTYEYQVLEGSRVYIKPRLTGFTFTPRYYYYPNITGNIDNADFAAQSIYSIKLEGVVQDKDENGIEGVAILFTGRRAMNRIVFSGQDGKFTNQLAYNWYGWLRPMNLAYTYNPWRIRLSGVKTDQKVVFVATKRDPVYAISGKVSTKAGAPVPGVLISFSGRPGLGLALTDDKGEYSQEAPRGWRGRVKPTLKGYYFRPRSARVRYLRAPVNIDFTAGEVAKR